MWHQTRTSTIALIQQKWSLSCKTDSLRGPYGHAEDWQLLDTFRVLQYIISYKSQLKQPSFAHNVQNHRPCNLSCYGMNQLALFNSFSTGIYPQTVSYHMLLILISATQQHIRHITLSLQFVLYYRPIVLNIILEYHLGYRNNPFQHYPIVYFNIIPKHVVYTVWNAAFLHKYL